MNLKYFRGCDQFGWGGCWNYIEDSFQIVFIHESREQFRPFYNILWCSFIETFNKFDMSVIDCL